MLVAKPEICMVPFPPRAVVFVKILIYFYEYEYLPAHMHVHYMCAVLEEAKRGPQIP